jgi:putative membrane protein
MMYDGGGYGGHWGWMLVSMAVTMMFLAGFVWIIARIIVDGKRRDSAGTMPGQPDALAVLKRRYASGEMDDAEYEHRRRVLLDPS